MDEAGNVSLTDFGMAKIIKPNEIVLSFCGTYIFNIILKILIFFYYLRFYI